MGICAARSKAEDEITSVDVDQSIQKNKSVEFSPQSPALYPELGRSNEFRSDALQTVMTDAAYYENDKRLAELENQIKRLKDKEFKLRHGDVDDVKTRNEIEDTSAQLRHCEAEKQQIVKSISVSYEMEKLRLAQNIDICFMVDCTSSMRRYIQQIEDHVQELTEMLEKEFKGIEVRLAFLGYRDFDTKDRFTILNFTKNISVLRSFVSALDFQSGHDRPEDVNGALQQSLKLQWAQTVRVLYHIGDAPPHGKEYYHKRDYYPDGHPDDKDVSDLLWQMKEKEIVYWFGHIHKRTNRMIRAFRNHIPIYKSNLEDPGTLIKKITTFAIGTVVGSVGKTRELIAARTLHSREKFFPVKKEYSPQSFDGSNSKLSAVTIRQYCRLNSLEEISEKHRDMEIVFPAKVQKSEYPFAQGEQRLAYAARLTVLPNMLPPSIIEDSVFRFDSKDDEKEKTILKRDVVLKEYFSRYYRVNDRGRSIKDMEVHSIAQYLAEEFDKLGVTSRKFRFIEPFLVEFGNNVQLEVYLGEQVLNGKFERISNNALHYKRGRKYDVVHAFTHWTYVYTNNYMMVTDLEGCITRKEILLTDPAIHCSDFSRFGKKDVTNLGEQGFRMFLETHSCNKYCQKVFGEKPWSCASSPRSYASSPRSCASSPRSVQSVDSLTSSIQVREVSSVNSVSSIPASYSQSTVPETSCSSLDPDPNTDPDPGHDPDSPRMSRISLLSIPETETSENRETDQKVDFSPSSSNQPGIDRQPSADYQPAIDRQHSLGQHSLDMLRLGSFDASAPDEPDGDYEAFVVGVDDSDDDRDGWLEMFPVGNPLSPPPFNNP